MLLRMLNRRRFIQSIAAAFAAHGGVAGCQPDTATSAALPANGESIIDLPEDFSYSVISRVGDLMSDGLPVPGSHDGMAAFAGKDGRINLVCNHELSPRSGNAGEYAEAVLRLPRDVLSRFYDRGAGETPGLGGTTTIVYNPKTGRRERQFLSLGGTDLNCAGGATPWGSWLTCEEGFSQPGTEKSKYGNDIRREQRHGYVFEVSAAATELCQAVPLTDMGRFEHEAAAVHAASGAVYLTEDRWYSLFYRFLPNEPGELHKGGKLQALAIAEQPSTTTHNWDGQDVSLNETMQTRWIDLDGADSDEDDLRLRGREAGAAVFARGEGLTVAGGDIVFTCTNGGPDRLGQVFAYHPSEFEGTSREADSPGQLTLIAESTPESLAHNSDNLTMAPWGDLIVCEDTADDDNHCALVGIRPDGSQYTLANNAYSTSELAGVCFSPDGKTLFVNIQYPGTTVAITGPWSRFYSTG